MRQRTTRRSVNPNIVDPPMPSVEEFAEEHTNTERIRFVALGMLAGALVVGVCKLWFFPWLSAFSASAPCRSVFGLSGSTVLAYGLFVGMPLLAALLVSVTLGRRGLRIVREGRVPTSGKKVFRRTKIQRGAKAKAIGYAHVFAVTPMLALSIWGTFQAETFARLPDRKPSACVAALSATNDAASLR